MPLYQSKTDVTLMFRVIPDMRTRTAENLLGYLIKSSMKSELV